MNKAELVDAIAKAMRGCDAIYLATDPDRELHGIDHIGRQLICIQTHHITSLIL